jgi:DNA-binding transcriptional ArsR family regulator
VASRTPSLLRLLGNAQRLAVLVELADSDGLTHSELRDILGLSKVTVSKSLTDLELAGLVVRPPTNRQPWECVARDATRAFLRVAAALGLELSGATAAGDEALRQRFS